MIKKILIIEDDTSIAELERDYMEINGFSAAIETNGDAGLANALNTDYDLILLDLMLPGLDGFEICRRLRMEKDIPILMVSARKEDVDKIRGLGLGADDFVIKPFSPGELVARVKAHLARYERLRGNNPSGAGEINIRGLLIDKSSHRVWVNQKEVSLTAKEFDLLVLLASNPNRVFSKNELFERIWGLDSLGDVATITVHIAKLREKIELVPSNPQYIETIWGVGYRFKL
jgi:Response regulators consisting of a CheY-like receiver domain and a winged-helix DNA-binding domain